LAGHYEVSGIPCLLVVNDKAKVLWDEAVEILWECEEADYEKSFEIISSKYSVWEV